MQEHFYIKNIQSVKESATVLALIDPKSEKLAKKIFDLADDFLESVYGKGFYAKTKMSDAMKHRNMIGDSARIGALGKDAHIAGIVDSLSVDKGLASIKKVYKNNGETSDIKKTIVTKTKKIIKELAGLSK